MPTHDTSKSRIVRMPKLTPDTKAVDIWFEQGMIYMEDPTDPDQVIPLSISTFEERIAGLTAMVQSFEEKYGGKGDQRVVYCGEREWKKFLNDLYDLLAESKQQLHVGLPPSIIAEETMARSPISVQSGFEGFKTSKAGLLVPG